MRRTSDGGEVLAAPVSADAEENKRPPARQGVDGEGSHTKNEIAINWNARLVFLLANALPPPPPAR